MIIDKRPRSEIDEYRELIKAVCSLSNLFAKSEKPYMDYRLAENLFCRCFNAENLSRSDCSVDARIEKIGIGIKTFVDNSTLQKVAEFNRDSESYRNLSSIDAVKTISALRNKRLEFTRRTYNVDDMFYHCLVRGNGHVKIVENHMDFVVVDDISKVESKGNIITFTDKLCDYSFNKSKSTLYKRFDCDSPLMNFDVQIHSDPFEIVRGLFDEWQIIETPVTRREYVVLPLYSLKRGVKFVSEKSGLNQWNGEGRKRSSNEVYIPVPARIRNKHPHFFPERSIEFELRLPDGVTVLSAKICQDSGKALMTNPNSALGDWILRKVLEVPADEIVKYSMLENLGINAVVIYKNSPLDYSIDFTYVKDEDEITDFDFSV